ncbi:hypothetical protein [Streptomyces justiciae]|uniref:hypothetical protein n=1 Tax=Streptomyces justiciae TaxID=2780140 RepID=UPI0021178801|nr:hypothetical protein [Streptomyces justiciae]MCW8376153.1 hypothetical protein [Streptomyces justiciae]
MTPSRILRRVALVGALVAVGAALPTTATGVRTRPAAKVSTLDEPARSGSPRSTVDRVADFYGAYLDVLSDSGRDKLAETLRERYLTARLREDLARWEKAHHKDGVLRGKGVPAAWKVVYNDSGMGHCWTRVTLTWEDSGNRVHHIRLLVRSDLETQLISGIRIAT